MTEKQKTAILHLLASFIGGSFGSYAIICRMTFGSSQTMNLIRLFENLLSRDILNFVIHLGAFLLYCIAIAIAMILSERKIKYLKSLSLAIDAICALILGFLPLDLDPVIAIYPSFFAMAFQWCSFPGIDGYTISSVFSTNNLRQFVTGLVHKAEGKKDGMVRAYGLTLLAFHFGVCAQYFLFQPFSIKGIWFTFIPIAIAFALSLVKTRETK